MNCQSEPVEDFLEIKYQNFDKLSLTRKR